jgi:hypothetical protein
MVCRAIRWTRGAIGIYGQHTGRQQAALKRFANPGRRGNSGPIRTSQLVAGKFHDPSSNARIAQHRSVTGAFNHQGICLPLGGFRQGSGSAILMDSKIRRGKTDGRWWGLG